MGWNLRCKTDFSIFPLCFKQLKLLGVSRAIQSLPLWKILPDDRGAESRKLKVIFHKQMLNPYLHMPERFNKQRGGQRGPC